MACASSCQTQDHPSYGACLRSQGLAVMGLESTGNDYSATKRMHAENAAYAAARKEGLQPAAPTRSAVDQARRAADATGNASGTVPILGE